MQVALVSVPGGVAAVELSDDGAEQWRTSLSRAEMPGWVAEREEADGPRWVWSDTSLWYPALLAAGVRVERCSDLRLSRRILRSALAASGTDIAAIPRDDWDRPPAAELAARRASSTTGTGPGAQADDGLFQLGDDPEALVDAVAVDDTVAEYARQRAALASSTEPGVLALLLAAECAGSLVAAEMSHAGLPWNESRHHEILVDALGEMTASGRPSRMEALVAEIRAALDLPELNPDSAVALLRGLQTAGLRVTSTSKWELAQQRHPVVEPLLRYKKMSRLLTANGWNWLDSWVHDGRFRPVYVVGGVVTGRWASDGGGALQLPHDIRDAVRPDPGWKLVVADASQLEPRVLAAMSADAAMARAGQSADMYRGMVESGAVGSRDEAKFGMLGALYGGTSGVSGRMLPRLTRAFPQAMRLVEDAARAGEQDQRVRTWLGRTSPQRGGAGFDETRTDAEQRRAQQDAKAWGRFTRNFVVQGSAAEWAMSWMGALRRRLWTMGEARGANAAPSPFTHRPHLVFFLHDELIVHTPAEWAEEVADAMRQSAAEAGRILFPTTEVEFAITVAIVDSYADAK